ncbi:MAG: type II/IV secretion system protein [Candidatus Moranbacteria bacterium]|nr:type II/IV secretion system protein [Candidatus Moranbacteria bacterium]
MNNNDVDKIKQILLEKQYVSQEDVSQAEAYAEKHQTSFLAFLLLQQILTKDLVGQAIAEYYGVSYADLNSRIPSAEQVRMIPEKIGKQYRVVLFDADDEARFVVTTDYPDQEGLLDILKSLFSGKEVVLSYSLSEDIDQALVHYRSSLETRFSKIIETQKRVAPEILDEIFSDAIVLRASDIHFEPQPKYVLIRFRIDGILLEAGRIPMEYYENIVNRVKIAAGLRIDEHFAAQDGSMRHERENNSADLRISIVPTLEGEKIVVRVLAEYVQNFALHGLGLSTANQDMLEKVSHKPFGMILVVGPTGSGKTTTLYSLVKFVNRPDINIMTIEDPVEYRVMGVNQIQVSEQKKLTFARGLRSIVRQDPDVILVGEIRDRETVEISVNAALTGHLLFSTFHSNDAATAIPRLLDMGAEPFLLASTLELVIAQRLVRRLCEVCRHSVSMSSDEVATRYGASVAQRFPGKMVTFYQGKGCSSCGQTGYRGRVGIFEFIHVSPEMKALILRGPSSAEIWDLARSQGSQRVFDDGVEKVNAGLTSIEELMRVVEPTSSSSEKKIRSSRAKIV